jgi:hypothetical protein
VGLGKVLPSKASFAMLDQFMPDEGRLGKVRPSSTNDTRLGQVMSG